MEAIVCRSSEQIYEDNLSELHTRLTQWKRRMENEGCFDWRQREFKSTQLYKLSALIASVENAILNDTYVNINSTELLGIKYSTLIRY